MTTKTKRAAQRFAASGCSANRWCVSFGALVPPLVEQLAGLADKETLERFDRYARAITMLLIPGIITSGECDRARRRLMVRIERAVKGSPNDEAQRPANTGGSVEN